MCVPPHIVEIRREWCKSQSPILSPPFPAKWPAFWRQKHKKSPKHSALLKPSYIERYTLTFGHMLKIEFIFNTITHDFKFLKGCIFSLHMHFSTDKYKAVCLCNEFSPALCHLHTLTPVCISHHCFLCLWTDYTALFSFICKTSAHSLASSFY